MYTLRQAGFILIAIFMAFAAGGCGNAVTNSNGTESEQYEEPAEKEETMQIKVTDGANE